MTSKGLIEEREGKGIAESQGRRPSLSWPCGKGKSFAEKDGKMGLPDHRLDILTPSEPILLTGKGDEPRIGKTLPKAAQ